MSQPTRGVGDVSPRGPAESPTDEARPSGEFDRVLERRQPGAARSHGEGEGTAARSSRPSSPHSERSDRRERRDAGEEGQSGKGGGGDRDGSTWRALPGDFAVAVGPAGARLEPAKAGGARAGELAAFVEQVAGKIVQAAELRLGAGGAAEASFRLDLAGLGEAGLQLQRAADGGIAIRFEAATGELANVLQAALPELLARLEARGLEIREIAVRDPDGAVRVQPGSGSEAGDAERRAADREGRGRRQPEPAPETDGEEA